MEKKEVRNQQEFDACVAENNIAVVIGCKVMARDDCKVEARGNSTVETWGNSTVVAWDNSTVEARDNTFIRFFSCSKITASEGVVILKHNQSDSIEGGRQLDIIKTQ